MANPSTRQRTRSAALRSGTGLKYGIAFTAPFLVLYLIFVIYPVLQAVWMSFHDWDLLGSTREFLGLDNFERMLWGIDITWSMTHQWVPRVILLALAVALLIRPLLRRRLTLGIGLGVAGILLIVVALGFHPAEGGFWYDPDFWVAFQNTLVFTAVSTPLIAGLGLVMALALQGNRRGARIYQMVFFLPYILPVSV
ncbi:MAG: sugar ABC transporter permease, partial [Microbacterium sp.]